LTDPFDTFVRTQERTDAPFNLLALPAYDKGWFSIPVKGKNTVPKGVTGAQGKVDEEKIKKFLLTREHGYDNLAIRHDGTIAIDVDVYAEKNGVESLALFAQERGLPPLPPTYSSTARGDDSPSRQYFYRLRSYVRLVSKPRVSGKVVKDVEICQFHHRYSVVYPSKHPDTGGVYTWYLPGLEGFSWGAPTTEMPRVEDLPYLPDEWLEALGKDDSEDLDLDADVIDSDDLISTFVEGAPSPPVQKAIDEARTQHPGHDETYSGMYKALMYGREGHPGVKLLASILIARHREYLETEHPERAKKGELEAIIRDAAKKAQQTSVVNRYRPYNPLVPLGTLNGTAAPTESQNGFTPLGSISTPTGPTFAMSEGSYDASELRQWVLPGWVWEKSPELSLIRQAALSRQVSPDVVLHSCLAIISSLLHHGSRLETGKGPTVLSYYAAAVGASGTGKTEALSCAEDLLDEWSRGQQPFLGSGNNGVAPYVRKNLGTGEGMVEAFMDSVVEEITERAEDGTALTNDDGEEIKKRIKVRKQVRHNALFSSDEGRQMLAIASRSGSTVMSTLCTLWSGADSGAANAKSENSRGVEKGTYVLGVLLGFQPETMDVLFEDAAGGAPQRFAFASTEHPDITEDEVDYPDGLKPQLALKAPLQMRLSDKHRLLIRRYNAMKNRKEITIGEFDGHRMLLHCRTAALLAIMHSQKEVSDEMWDLAEVVVNTSCKFRDHLAGRAARERAEAERRKAELAVHTNVASALAVEQSGKVAKVADAICDKLSEKDGTGRRKDIKLSLTGSLRKHFDEAVDLAVADGRIIAEEVDNPETGRKVQQLRLTESD
jgi:hypothetical protein